MSRIIILVAAVTLSTLGCDNPLEPSDIVNQTWQLVSIERAGSAPILVDDPSRYTLRLEDEAAAVTSDCNSCNGSYSISDSSLEMGPLACTRVFCGDESLDPLFPQALEGGHRLVLSGSELRLQSFARTLRFRN